MTHPRIAILIVAYNGIDFLPICLNSLAAVQGEPFAIFVVDNNSTDGTARYIEDRWENVHLIRSDSNRGYAGGNSYGWGHIQKEMPSVEYILLLNQDTIVTPDFLVPLTAALDTDATLVAVQPQLLLDPERNKINSLGNITHYLGFGYSSYNGSLIDAVAINRHPINYASGAAVLLRVSTIAKVGLFDDFMFMYLEDLDLGWRLSLAGYKQELIPESIVYHHYEFSRGMRQYYYFERNRLWIVLKNYRLATIVILLPALLIMEVLQLVYAIMNGMALSKLRSYAYFLDVRNIRNLYVDRKKTQALRVVTDRSILRSYTGMIEFQPLHSPAVTLSNIFFEFYRRLILLLIHW